MPHQRQFIQVTQRLGRPGRLGGGGSTSGGGEQGDLGRHAPQAIVQVPDKLVAPTP